MTLPRPLVTLRLLLVLALVALAAPLFVSPTANTAVAADTGSDTSKTVEGNWHRWIPNKKLINDPDFGPYWEGGYDDSTPSVTVDRTTNLGDEVVNVSWKNFTPTSNEGTYAPTEEGGQPSEVPFRADGDQSALYGVQLYQCRGLTPTLNPSKNVDNGTKSECYAESTFNSSEGSAGVNNAVLSATRRNGEGFAQFHVENKITNDLLRCSPSQPCSLVVVQNQGGVYNLDDRADASTEQCDDHSDDYSQPPLYGFGFYAGTNGDLGPCSWSKRIVVPLTFGPLATSCAAGTPAFSASGAPTLSRGLNQLLTGWCAGRRPLNFDYNFSVSEGEARDRFLSGSTSGFTTATDVALTSEPADPAAARARPFAYAPIANNAVTIPYVIDNAKTGRPITDLRLSARLVAKLLTQSYSPVSWDCKQAETPWCATAVRGNPQSIFDDPEFAKLNFRGDHPGRSYFPIFSQRGSQQREGSFFPTVAAGRSDLTLALTRWIASDKAALDFLHGKPDPFPGGMRINSYYLVGKGKGSIFPTDQFEALDAGYTAPQKRPASGALDPTTDPRYHQGMQGSFNPVGVPAQVNNVLLRNKSTAYDQQGDCPSPFIGCPDRQILPVVFSAASPEPAGVRDLTGVTNNVESRAYGFSTADLVTAKGSEVGPTNDAIVAAADGLHTNADGVTQRYDAKTASAKAYPLVLPVYAMVPTCGLTSVKAKAIRDMLGRVTTSQTYGDTPGTLARGLVKLTGKQLADTRHAATLVSTKRCPGSAPSKPQGTSKGGSDRNGEQGSGSGSDGGTGNDSGGGLGFDSANDNGGSAGGSGGAPAAGSPADPTSGASSAAPSSGSSSALKSATNVGYRLDDDGGSVSLLPIVLLLGALALIGGPLGWWAMATAPGRTARDRLRHLVVGAGGWRR